MAVGTNLGRERPALIEVQCVSRIRNNDPCARIQYIGGFRDGLTWELSQSDAIAAIERGDARFYVRIDKHSYAVVVGMDENGRQYLKSSADIEDPTSLLKLPECPRSPRLKRRDTD